MITVESRDNLIHITIDQPLTVAEVDDLIHRLTRAKNVIERAASMAAKEKAIASEIAQFRRRHTDAIDLPGGALWSPKSFRGIDKNGRYITPEKVPAGAIPKIRVRASGGRTAHRWNGGPRCLCCKDNNFLYRPEPAKDDLPMRKGAS